MKVIDTIPSDEFDPTEQRIVVIGVEENEAIKSMHWPVAKYNFVFEDDLPDGMLPNEEDGAWTMQYHREALEYLQSTDEDVELAKGILENAPDYPAPIQAKKIIEHDEYGDKKLILLAHPAYNDDLFDDLLNWDITHHTFYDLDENRKVRIIDADTTSLEHFEQVTRDNQIQVEGLKEFMANPV